MTEPDAPKLLIISPAVSAVPEEVTTDRGGGEEHGRIGDAFRAIVGRAVSITAVDPETFAEKLSTSLSHAAGAIEHKVATTFGGFVLEEIKVSLAISADGDIGIAAGGLEASIEVAFKRGESKVTDQRSPV